MRYRGPYKYQRMVFIGAWYSKYGIYRGMVFIGMVFIRAWYSHEVWYLYGHGIHMRYGIYRGIAAMGHGIYREVFIATTRPTAAANCGASPSTSAVAS